MANQDTKVKIVDIQVRYQEAVDALAKYRASIDEAKKHLADLKKELKDGKISQQDFDKQAEASRVFIQQQTTALNELTKQMQNQITVNKEEEGSLKQLRAELANATAEFNSMSRAEREGANGQELKKHILEIQNELRNATKETQNFERAVGNETKVKIVDIQVRYKDAVDAMAQYRNSIEEAKARMAQLKQELKDGKISQEDYDKQMESSRIFIKQQSEAVSTLEKHVNNQLRVTREEEGSLKQLRAELSNATAAYDAMSRAEREGAKGRELKQHILEVTNELKEAEQATLRFYRNVGNYPTSMMTGLTSIKDKFKEIGQTIMGIVTGGGLVAFGKKVIEIGRNFNDGMARVHAVTQGTVEDLEMMGNEAKRLGATTAYTAAQAAGALENLTRNGLDAAQATDALSPTLQFAQANTIELAKAADIMTNVSNGFNLGVDGMAQVSDALSWTASHSATNVEQLAEALKNAAPFGAALGQSVEEVNASLGVLADVGIKGSDAGSALRMVMLGLATTTKKQQKVFEEYGIEITQETLKTDGLTKTLEKLRDSGIMNASDSASKLADVFGRRVSPQAMALLNNIDALKEKLGGLQEAQGTTEAMFEVSMSNVSGAIKSLESAWEAFLLSIYDSNSDALVGPLEALKDIVNWLREHLGDVGHVMMTMIASISFAKLTQSAMAAFTQMRDSAVSNAQAATQQVEVCQSNEIALRKQTATLTRQLESASAEERGRIETMLVAKKRELAEAEKATHKAKNDEIVMWDRAAALNSSSTWSAAMSACTIAVQGFVAAAKTALKGFVFTAVIMLAFEALQKLFSLIDTSSDSTFGKITSAVGGFIKKGLNILINAFKSVINWIKDFVENSRIMQVWLFSLKTQFAAIGFVFKTVWSLLKTGIKQIGNAFKGLISIVGGVATALEGLFTLNFDNVKKGIKQVGDAVVNFWKDTTTNFKGAGEEIADNFKGAVEDVKGAADDLVNSKAFGGTGSGGGATTPKTPTKTTPPKKTTPTTTVTDDTEDGGGSGGGGGKGKGDKDDKKKREEERRLKKLARIAQEEAKLVAEADKAMVDLLGECIEKRQAMLEAQYNGEISKLRTKLETDKTLTEASKEAIEELILAKEMKLQEELDKLDEENLKKRIKEQQRLIDSRIALVRKGSDEEYNLKLESLQKQNDLDQLALKQEEENAQKGAASALMYHQEKLAALEANPEASEEAIAREREAIVFSEQEILRVSQEYAELRLNKQEEFFMQQDELRRQHEEDVFNESMQVYQNEIAQLEIANTEKMDAYYAGEEGYWTLQETLNEQNLDVVTEFEMRKLEIQQQMAEQRLDFIMKQGRLETETEAGFNARVLKGKQELADAKAKINKASIKNEKAYLNAMKGVANGLISLCDEIGESNEAFAKMSKIITLFQLAVDTGKAIGAGVANAMQLPYPVNIAAVASTVGVVLGNIATAIATVKKANFATGGKVTGPGTGTSDSIPANLSNGEFVMTAKATKLFEPLLMVMNSIGAGAPINTTKAQIDTNELYGKSGDIDSFTRAMQEIRPVVSVEEITEVQHRVETIQNIDTIA